MGEKCKKCGKALEKYYHDCGDHFSAGPAPGSGWRYKDCTCNESIEETINYNNDQFIGGKLEIPDGWFVYMADFDAEEPYIIVVKDGCYSVDDEVKLPVPKSLAHYLSKHFCGSKKMVESIREGAERNIQYKLKKLLGIHS